METGKLASVEFEQIDTNGDGVIDRDEYRLASQAGESSIDPAYTPSSTAQARSRQPGPPAEGNAAMMMQMRNRVIASMRQVLEYAL